MIPHEYFVKIKNYFNGDIDKTFKWFSTSNPALGYLSPLEMLKSGKEKNLKKFIDNALLGINP